MTNIPANDGAPEAANSLAAQSSAIALRPSPEMAAVFPELNRALVRIGEENLAARVPSLPERRAPRSPRKIARRPRRAARKSKRFIARPPEKETPLERHQRKCAVCRHPEREAVEDLFVHWHQPSLISRYYDLEIRSIYRHAHATGLLRARRRNLRCVLEHILEDAMRVQVTSDSIVRAVRAYTCLTDDNRWVEPTARVVFSSTARAPKRPPDRGRRPKRIRGVDERRISRKALSARSRSKSNRQSAIRKR
jgi:hypothetical protein